MDRLYIKARKGYEQTGAAVKFYLDAKKVPHDLVIDENEFLMKRHLYKKVFELGEVDCVNTELFTKSTNQSLMLFHFGDFSLEKIKRLSPLTHVYGEGPWPIHNFISQIEYKKLPILSKNYSHFLHFDEDPNWVYMSFVYAGCEPIFWRDIKIKLVEDYVKELGIV